ncbi:MerR family transcriptional regulator [Pseudorhodoplanes sp.]|uniref:MerR family transcriptional regulator n=1 Tax=Pseudorhodoplanes sp. TaxID=1934341 RepID=UPI003D0A5B94
MDKAPDAFRTISEVADDLSVPQHVLRFWETRFSQIKPMKRAGGRRYYRPDDVDLLRGIHHLLYGEGYTIRGVQRILRDQGLKFVQGVWQPGAEQPSHGPVEDEDGVHPEEMIEEMPAAAEPRPQATPAAIRAQMSREDLRRLQAALFELSECRRLLDYAMQGRVE